MTTMPDPSTNDEDMIDVIKVLHEESLTERPLGFIPRSAYTDQPRIHPDERARRKKAAKVARNSRRKNRQ